MLTLAYPEVPNVSSQPFPYQCRAAAYPFNEVHSIPLGSHNTASPRQALRWLQERTRHITDQLDVAYARPGVHWLTDETEHKRALAYMATGTGYQLTLYDDSTGLPAGSDLMKTPARGYWCECWTKDLTSTEGPALRASFDAYSAPQADRWVAVTLRTLTGPGRRRLRRGMDMALRRPHRDAPSPTALRTLHGDHPARQHPHHLGDPPCALPATRTPAGR